MGVVLTLKNMMIMKTVYTFILSCAAILAVAACNKEVQVEDTPQNNEPVYETLSVKVGAETKVTLETNAAKSAFESGDKIAVWTGAGAFQSCTVDGEGKISVNISSGARSNYAVYYNGATIPTFESSTLKLTLPDTYNYDDVAGDKNPVPMVAKNVSSDPTDMTFYAVGTLFRVTVKAIPSDATGLVFQFPGKKVNGTFTVTNPGTSTPSVATSAPGSGEDKVTVTFAAGTATEMTLNIPLPTGAYDDVYITPVGGETKVASARHIKAGGYTAARANGRTLTATLVSFSVSSEKKVIFAPGNLRATLKTFAETTGGKVSTSSSWKFTDNQYDYISTYETFSIGSNFDHFGWVGSGTTDPLVRESYGVFSATDNVYYGNTGASEVLYHDWGALIIGSYAANTWRTPTGGPEGEWRYVIAQRDGASSKRGNATVGGKHGFIILPDSFTDPMKNNGSEAFVPWASSNDYTANVYTTGGDWEAMEAAGAIFLPAAAGRVGTNVTSSTPGKYGYYMSSTAYSADEKYRLRFAFDEDGKASSLSSYSHGVRRDGHSVRLVRDL